MVEIIDASKSGISKSAQLILRGEVVAIPTETVYGLAADATNDLAIAKIFAAKNRPSFNPLIIHVPNESAAKQFCLWNDVAEKLAARFWPGPLTIVLKLNPQSPVAISRLALANLDTIAIRIPAHPIAKKLLRACNVPLAAPSANASGSISPTQSDHVIKSLGERIQYVLSGGESTIGLESTIIDVTSSPAILRLGGIDIESIQNTIGPVDYLNANHAKTIKAPGMLLQHYAPSIPIRIGCDDPGPREALIAFGDRVPDGFSCVVNLSEKSDLIEAASKLYAAMHTLDCKEFSGIAVMPIPNYGLGLAINDRLRRAVGNSAK